MTHKKIIIHRISASALLLSLLVAIYCLSAENAEESKETSLAVTSWLGNIFGSLPDEFIRSLAHGCEFAALGFLMHNAIYSFKRTLHPFITVALSFLYAVSDEIHQLFVPGRAFQFSDLAVDLAGILAGTVTFMLLIYLLNRKRTRKTD